MNISNILRLGYFDNIIISSTVNTSNGKGLVIRSSTFRDNIVNDYLIKLRINIIGEVEDDNVTMKKYREDNEIKKSNYGRESKDINTGRYIIGYMDVSILRGKYNKIICGRSVEKDPLEYTEDTSKIELVESAIKLRDYIQEKHKLEEGEPAVAIIDKVYVFDIFRRNGVSGWLHENIFEILHHQSAIFTSGIVLQCGDFSNESYRKFGLDKNSYMELLLEHYIDCGYKQLNKSKFKVNYSGNKFIMYKTI